LNELFRRGLWQFGLNFEGYLYLGPYDASQMLYDFLRDLRGVAAKADRVDVHRRVEPEVLWRWLNYLPTRGSRISVPLLCFACRFSLGWLTTFVAPAAACLCRGIPGVGIHLGNGGLWFHQYAISIKQHPNGLTAFKPL
jgi:hypothetical protein